MAKMTILDMVQDIMNDIDGEFVNSIDDTEEAMQVAQIIRSTYNAMMSNRNWAHTRHPLQLTPTTNLAQPTHVVVPDKVKELYFVNYDISTAEAANSSYQEMKYKEPDTFLRLTNEYNTSEGTVTQVTDDSGITIQVLNNTAPSFYTSFDDRTLVFNAYDSEVESNITSNRMQAMAYMMPDLIIEDNSIPDLPDDAFALLVESVKSKASWKLRQVADPAAQAEAKRQVKWLARNHRRIHKGIKYPNYGRK